MTKARLNEIREMLENLYAEIELDRRATFGKFVDAEDGSEEEKTFDLQVSRLRHMKRNLDRVIEDLYDLENLIAE